MQVHRRLLFDDAFGVGEALNESAYGTGLVARGKHWLLLAGEGTGMRASCESFSFTFPQYIIVCSLE